MVTPGRVEAGLLKGNDVELLAVGANVGRVAVVGRVVGVGVGVGRVMGAVGLVVAGIIGAIASRALLLRVVMGLKLVVTIAICILLLQVLLRVRF